MLCLRHTRIPAVRRGSRQSDFKWTLKTQKYLGLCFGPIEIVPLVTCVWLVLCMVQILKTTQQSSSAVPRRRKSEQDG